MNWYKQVKTSSSLGMTIGKWLDYARTQQVDIFSVTNDINSALQDDSGMLDADTMSDALNEAHQFLLSRGQTDPYSPQQSSIVDAVKNLVYNPTNTNNENGGLNDSVYQLGEQQVLEGN